MKISALSIIFTSKLGKTLEKIIDQTASMLGADVFGALWSISVLT